jgi:hypothetical protein
MSFRDSVVKILEGGLPQLLDTGSRAGNAQGDTGAERRSPEPTNRDVMPGFDLQKVTQSQILTITAAVLAVLGVVYLIRR